MGWQSITHLFLTKFPDLKVRPVYQIFDFILFRTFAICGGYGVIQTGSSSCCYGIFTGHQLDM